MPWLPATALILTLALQSSGVDGVRAVELARAGRTADALALFERIAAASPDDVDARLWIARLHARLGQTARAEDEFRAVLRDHPADIDGQIGLAGVLLRRGEWGEALAILREAEPRAGENADLFAALGRAYHRAGDDRAALEYFGRAAALSPNDRDVHEAYEDLADLYWPFLSFEGFGEHVGPSTNALSGTLTAAIRVAPRLRIEGAARVQERGGGTDSTFGGAVEYRADRADVVRVYGVGGPDNVSLPRADIGGDVTHYTGPFEAGGSLRTILFKDVDVVAVSPIFAWDSGRWRTDTRYTYSHSSYHQTAKTSNDSSVLARETWRPLFRLNVNIAYAYGIEDFEDLTADRIGHLSASTIAAGVRIRTPQMAQMFLTWEHQWRSNGVVMDRVTVVVMRSFR